MQKIELGHSDKIWQFNSMFDQYSMDDCIRKGSEMERERAKWSQMPLLQEIYQQNWSGWRDMPGAGLIQEIIDYYEDERKKYSGEPWYPRPITSQLVWNGELSKEEFKELELRTSAIIEQGISATAFAAANAYMEKDTELKHLAVWWQFDEHTHEEMLDYFNTQYVGIKEEDFRKLSGAFTDDLIKLPKVDHITKENASTLARLQAMRDGPPVLVGVSMLNEMENPWVNQKTAPALRKHYGFPNDALPFFNVHAYVDYFHIRLGQYILGKYASTKEIQELCKAFYVGQRQFQLKRSKQVYDEIKRGEFVVKLTKDDNHGF